GLRADVEETALPAGDAPADDIGAMGADGHDRIRGGDVVASVLIGGIPEPGIGGQQVGPIERERDATAHQPPSLNAFLSSCLTAGRSASAGACRVTNRESFPEPPSKPLPSSSSRPRLKNRVECLAKVPIPTTFLPPTA